MRIDRGEGQRASGEARICDGKDEACATSGGISSLWLLKHLFRFRTGILSPGVPARAAVVCVESKALVPMTTALVLLVVGLCALLWFRSGLKPSASFAVLVALAAIAGGARLILEQDFAGPVTAVAATLVASAVVFGALAMHRPAQRGSAGQPGGR